MKKIIFTLILSCCCINGFSQSVFTTEKTSIIEDVEEVIEDVEEEVDDIEEVIEDVEEVAADIEIEEEKSRKFRLWIPAFTFDVASWFVDKESNNEEKQMLKSLGNVSLFVLTNTDLTDKRTRRLQKKFTRKVNRKVGEDLVVIETSEATVNVKAMYNRKGEVKKAVVFVDADGTLMFAKVRGLPDMDLLMKLINE